MSDTVFDPNEEITIKTAVACRDANGIPTLYLTDVVTTREGYDEGEHYEIASAEAENERYDQADLVFDKNDMNADQWVEAFLHFHGDNPLMIQRAIRKLKGQL
jgi:hypothetical protein